MTKNLVILVLTVFLSVEAIEVRAARKRLLRDGFVLAGADGKLTYNDGNDNWFFEFDSGVGDDAGLVKAGASLELLPSATLEKMVTDANDRAGTSYRLWGKVTRYESENFIFCFYFLPLSKAKPVEPSTSKQPETRVIVNEPNDALKIPAEVAARLKAGKAVPTAPVRKGLELKRDSILADRTGFIVTQADGQLVFSLDALGRNVPQTSLGLLPCQALERAQVKQSTQPDPMRFKVAGIVTKYKGNHYLLLQRARQVYSHENFPR